VAAVETIDAKALVDNAARKYGLPPELVRAVVAVESAYRPDAVSSKGAIGLMQLMPATARELGADPKVAEQNVDAGTRYLRDLLLKYDQRMFHALAAYNAGPGAVDKYHGVPPYRETHAYILNVLAQMAKVSCRAVTRKSGFIAMPQASTAVLFPSAPTMPARSGPESRSFRRYASNVSSRFRGGCPGSGRYPGS
jgi:hypothetical protein